MDSTTTIESGLKYQNSKNIMTKYNQIEEQRLKLQFAHSMRVTTKFDLIIQLLSFWSILKFQIYQYYN